MRPWRYYSTWDLTFAAGVWRHKCPQVVKRVYLLQYLYITLYYITLHYVMLRYITLHYIFYYILYLLVYYVTLRYITLYYIFYYIFLYFIVLEYLKMDWLMYWFCAGAACGLTCFYLRHSTTQAHWNKLFAPVFQGFRAKVCRREKSR